MHAPACAGLHPERKRAKARNVWQSCPQRVAAARRIRRFPGEASAPRLHETGMQWVLKQRAALWATLAGCCGADVFSSKPSVHGASRSTVPLPA